MIDAAVQEIIDEQYKRAREILDQHADGHHDLAELLLTREVIYTEDAENIFGKRPWKSRTEEIMKQDDKDNDKEDNNESDNANGGNTDAEKPGDTGGNDEAETPDETATTPPPFHKE